MLLRDAIEGFCLELSSGNYSDCTIKLYHQCLRELAQFLSNPPINDVTPTILQGYMSFLRHEYKSKRDGKRLAGSSLDNRWKAIRSFFKWAEKRLGAGRPDLDLERPRYAEAEIDHYNEDEIHKLVEACQYSRQFQRWNTKPYRFKRHQALRDYAIVCLMLDTGLRVGEVARLEVKDLNIQTGELVVLPFSTMRKTKGNTVVIGKRTRQAVWLYLHKMRPDYQPGDLLFNCSTAAIQEMVEDLGKRAGVKGCNCHRFRHTFAIQFLRNGGSVFELQMILGHTTLDMSRRYAKLAHTDIIAAHRRASPVDRMKI